MSHFCSIGTVTATLQAMMQQAVDPVAPGVTVTIKRPEARGEAHKDVPALNIFLFRTSQNVTFRNHDVPTRSQNGRLITQPTCGIDLDYLFTFYGPGLTPHVLLGRTIAELHAEPYLTAARIQAAIKDSTSNELLKSSDLDKQTERVRIEPLPMELEELTKLWSVLLQVPYDLSVAYRVSVVFISADLQPAKPKLVADDGRRIKVDLK